MKRIISAIIILAVLIIFILLMRSSLQYEWPKTGQIKRNDDIFVSLPLPYTPKKMLLHIKNSFKKNLIRNNIVNLNTPINEKISI